MKDAKTIYAQSSDIKSRTYLEYRKDMKKKAIAELEILPWLNLKLKELTKQDVRVEKYGGDKFIWFLRKGGITREPDFIVIYPDGKKEYIEFQYAKNEIKAYDFKISKIAPSNRKLKKRVPKKDTKILYIIKPIYEFALIEPEWIVNHSEKTVAAAWGNTPVFRVKKEDFEKILIKDETLKNVCEKIDKKNFILDFQHKALDNEKNRLSSLLQAVIDENRIVEIMPKSLDGFFKVCFILNHLDKTPVNANLWLIYLLSYVDQELNSYEIFQLIYCLDFLYPRINLMENELSLLVKKIKEILNKINSFVKKDGSYLSDKSLAPLEDTRYALFVVNILEDLIQDILYYYGKDVGLTPITQIYQDIPNIDLTYDFISK